MQNLILNFIELDLFINYKFNSNFKTKKCIGFKYKKYPCFNG